MLLYVRLSNNQNYIKSHPCLSHGELEAKSCMLLPRLFSTIKGHTCLLKNEIKEMKFCIFGKSIWMIQPPLFCWDAERNIWWDCKRFSWWDAMKIRFTYSYIIYNVIHFSYSLYSLHPKIYWKKQKHGWLFDDIYLESRL